METMNRNHDNRNNDSHNDNRPQWVVFKTFRFGHNDPNVVIDDITKFENGNIVCSINKLALRMPMYSYKIGMWKGDFVQPNLRPIDDGVEEAFESRAKLVAALIVHAEKLITSLHAADEHYAKEMQATRDAKRKSFESHRTMPPRTGKTARDHAKTPSGHKTNDPTISQKMKNQKG